MTMPSFDDVLDFWFSAGHAKWFTKDEAFDAEVTRRFLAVYEAADNGELTVWETAPDSALAKIIVFDQFPRNMFRGSARAFHTDEKARGVADRALVRHFDEKVAHERRTFLYLPFMHSEDPRDQERSVRLYKAAGNADDLKYAEQHAAIIHRFGRFPHRNAVLGRGTTPEEQAFLDGGGFTG